MEWQWNTADSCASKTVKYEQVEERNEGGGEGGGAEQLSVISGPEAFSNFGVKKLTFLICQSDEEEGVARLAVPHVPHQGGKTNDGARLEK